MQLATDQAHHQLKHVQLTNVNQIQNNDYEPQSADEPT